MSTPSRLSEYLKTHELPGLALVLNLNGGLIVLLYDLEWPMGLVALDFGIVDFTSNETLSVEDGIFGVRVVCVFRGVTNTVQNASERHLEVEASGHTVVHRL